MSSTQRPSTTSRVEGAALDAAQNLRSEGVDEEIEHCPDSENYHKISVQKVLKPPTFRVSGAINLLLKNGSIIELSKASDNLNISALSTPVEKYFLCYPR